MASDKKANQGIMADRRSKTILGLVLALLVIAVLAFFISISGVLSKVVTGAKVTRVVNGQQETVDSLSIIECSYYFRQAEQTYRYYGLLNDETDLDSVIAEGSEQTYYEIIMNQAASTMRDLVLKYDYAKSQGFDDHGAAERIARMALEDIEETAAMYNYSSVEQFLQANYGNGMSSRVYMNIIEREAYVQAYESSLAQMQVDASEIETEISDNPAAYNTVSFNVYYFAVDVGIEYSAEDALADAEGVRDEAADSDSFREAVVSRLSVDQIENNGFTDGANPTYHENQRYSSWQNYFTDEVLDFIFVDGELGSATVVPNIVTGEGDEETISGYYVVLVNDRFIDEAPTVSYRVLTLSSTPDTVADVLARANEIKNSITDEDSFIRMIVENSESMNEIATGGYVGGRQASAFETTSVAEDGSEITVVNEPEIVNWLFDANTHGGQVLVQVAADSSNVKIIYFIDRLDACSNEARTTILNGNVSTITTLITTSNEPAVDIRYEWIRRLGYID